jgi:hypothetical protein
MLRTNLLIVLLLIALVSKADVTAVFNWAAPKTLTPACTAPTSADRYGDYVSNVEFSSNGVKLKINDDAVQTSSDKARFVYDYYTETPELRSNLNSFIEITAADGYDVSQVIFEGAKAGESYLSNTAAQGTFKNGTWTAAAATSVAKFEVTSTINCSKITVICSQTSGVTDITAESCSSSTPDADTDEWFSLTGATLTHRPTLPGVYIHQKGKTKKKVLIR